MRGWTLTRRLRTALVGFVVVLLVAATAVVLALRQADQALKAQTDRAFPARVAASQLLTSLVDQETGLRGYALTHNQRFLEPYRMGLVAEQQARARLDRYVVAADPARLDLLTVDAAITAWRDQYASLRSTDTTPMETDATLDFGRELFDRVRSTNSALDARLASQVRTARNESDRDRELVLVVLAGIGVVILAAVVGLQRALRASVLQPMARLGEQVAVVSSGSYVTAIRPEGPPDVRALTEGVESMRLELVRALAEVAEQQRAVERRAAELARSNADLEQFAYVASHDLQEPLRKVASFCQLLEQRYGDQLDERGRQYVAFAVDGAKRMQRLITDLLTFSRVGRTSEGVTDVDLAQAVRRAWAALDERAEESGGSLDVTVGGSVRADPALLDMLLVNLLGNSLKYRRDDVPPLIAVSSADEGAMLRVDVADNGIGIPDEYGDKVFVIFQRLHGRDEYGGTGIGLALAKKVVEFHGGHIELRPSPLGGTCVSFTLPIEENHA
ncbi:MAG: multi-sensor signal transduction histidine kinase [Frankiales bacterium]|nr:multi-sensor signal transduction histidine kinase [Frankiales bacterium]